MAFIFSRPGLMILLSAVLFAVAVMLAQFYLSWVCLVPFFIAITGHKGKKAFRSGALLGFAFGVILLYWMPSLISSYAGLAYAGVLVYILGIIVSVFYYGLVAWALQWYPRGSLAAGWNALWVASVWTLAEWLFSTAFPGMPWFGLFRIGNALLDNLYAIQAATLGGAYLLSFVVVLVNYWLAAYLAGRQWKMAAIPLGIVLLYMIGGYGLLGYFQQQYPRSGQALSVAILCDNTTPDVKWSEENGSFLMQRLMDLNLKGAATQPQLALWTESVVPWTYRADDDFIKEVLKTTAPFNITHVIGMTTDCNERELYNSAYCLQPDGKVLGRYDKHYPVSLAEKPLGFLSLPFSGNAARFYEKEGTSPLPVPTPYGKAGVLICNDGTVPGATVMQARNGAAYLLSLSNDAWFSDVSYLVRQHFLNTKLRAVEVRKDMALNCNMGTSGLVQAGGETELASGADDSFVANVSVYGNKCLTLYAAMPLLLIYIIVGILFIFIFTHVLFIQKKSNQQ